MLLQEKIQMYIWSYEAIVSVVLLLQFQFIRKTGCYESPGSLWGFFSAKQTVFTPHALQQRHKSRASDKLMSLMTFRKRKYAHFYSSAAEARSSLAPSPARPKHAAHCFFFHFFRVYFLCKLFPEEKGQSGTGGEGDVGAGAIASNRCMIKQCN